MREIHDRVFPPSSLAVSKHIGATRTAQIILVDCIFIHLRSVSLIIDVDPVGIVDAADLTALVDRA